MADGVWVLTFKTTLPLNCKQWMTLSFTYIWVLNYSFKPNLGLKSKLIQNIMWGWSMV